MHSTIELTSHTTEAVRCSKVVHLHHMIGRKFRIFNAQLEAYLSSNAFHILFLVLYFAAMALMFIWGAHDAYHHVRRTIEREHPTWVSVKWCIAIARGAGYTMNLNCAIALLLACRKLVTWIRNTQLQKVIPLDKIFPRAHIIVGWAIMIAAIVHVIFHFVWLIRFDQFDKLELWSISMTVIVGCVLSLVFAVMFVTALPWFRNKKSQWRIFYVIHQGGAFLFFVLLALHGMEGKKPETWIWVAPALAVYALDRVLRHFSTKTAEVFLDAANSKLKPGKILELRIRKPFNYKAGQFAEIAVPVLGREWHPFTIASAPHEESMVFYIKADGDWCTKLYDAFNQRERNTETRDLVVKIRGPYGAPVQHTAAYNKVVLIGGGIGATPFVSIAKELHHDSVANVRENASVPEEECEEAAADLVGEELANQLRVSIEHIYGYGRENENEEPVQEVKEDAVKQRADSLTLESFESKPSDACEARTESAIDVESNIVIPQRIRQILEHWHPRKRLLFFLHSTRVTLGLSTIVVVRFALVCILAIWRRAEFGWVRTVIHSAGHWAVLVDAILGLILACVMLVVLVLEMSFMKTKFFTRPRRILDLFAFFPLAVLSAVASIRCSGRPTANAAMTIVDFAVLLPLQFLLLANRLYRSSRSGTLLAYRPPNCESRCEEEVPDADFVWVTRTVQDDEWLLDELRPLAAGASLRLHRFITRQTQEEVDQESHETHIATEAGRPDWVKLLTSIADRTTSGSEVGVFFCGPKSMGAALKSVIREVEVKSRLRGGFLATLSDAELKRNFSVDNRDDVMRLRRFGCFVRFVFREENF